MIENKVQRQYEAQPAVQVLQSNPVENGSPPRVEATLHHNMERDNTTGHGSSREVVSERCCMREDVSSVHSTMRG